MKTCPAANGDLPLRSICPASFVGSVTLPFPPGVLLPAPLSFRPGEITLGTASVCGRFRWADGRLTFDAHWDRATGFRMRQVLVSPVIRGGKYLLGALHFVNCAGGKPTFTRASPLSCFAT